MKIYINFTLFVLIVIACTQNQPQVTSNGYEYKYYLDSPGEKATKGQYVNFSLDIVDHEGTIIQSYPSEGLQPSIEIPEADPEMFRRNPILDVLQFCSTGDSVGLFIPMDSMPQVPPEYANAPFFEYRLYVKEVMSKDDYQSKMAIIQERQEEDRQAVMVRFEEVKTLLDETISAYNAGNLANDLKNTEDGVEYIIHEGGSGKMPEINKMVKVQYYGSLQNGESFDNSFAKGVAYPFTLGRGEVIRGWDSTIPYLTEGTKATLFIPYSLAYGEQGRPPQIPAKSDLVFYIEIEKAY